jgi:hypothetical protein
MQKARAVENSLLEMMLGGVRLEGEEKSWAWEVVYSQWKCSRNSVDGNPARKPCCVTMDGRRELHLLML